MFGTILRLPGEFFLRKDFSPDPNIFIEEYREHMRLIRPIPVAHHYKKRIFYFKDLYNCTHVHIRDMARKSLERPYTGPYKVLEHPSDRVFKIEVKGVPRSVSVELLKPAYFIPDDPEHLTSGNGFVGNQPTVQPVPNDGSVGNQPAVQPVPIDGSVGNQLTVQPVPNYGPVGIEPAVKHPALKTYVRKKVVIVPSTKN